jgi:hypothetical protein
MLTCSQSGVCRVTFILTGLLTLNACTTPRTFVVIGPPGKSDAAIQADAAACNQMVANMRSVYPSLDLHPYFIGCMTTEHGNVLRAADGTIYKPIQNAYAQQDTAPPPAPAARDGYCNTSDPRTGNIVSAPCYVPPAEASPSELPSTARYTAPPSSAPEQTPDSSQPAASANRFRTVVELNQDLIFLVAHPKGHIESKSVTVKQSDSNDATIVDDVAWRGPSGNSFRTTLRFKISYDGEGTIDSVNVETEEINDPFPPAFWAVEVAKKAVLYYANNKMKDTLGRVAISLINSEISVKDGLANYLKHIANNPQDI